MNDIYLRALLSHQVVFKLVLCAKYRAGWWPLEPILDNLLLVTDAAPNFPGI